MAVRFYMHPDHHPHRTLALEEVCLQNIREDDIMLYLYRHRPSVIIGRTQNAWAECRHDVMQQDSIILARRITGGGAVYHDSGNLNFSFIAGKNIYDTERQLGVILRAVRHFGIEAGFSGRNDILADGRKFSGNAFGVRANGSVHHGTLLIGTDKEKMAQYLSVSPDKIAAKGVASVRSRVVNLSELNPEITPDAMAAALRESFAAEYGEPVSWHPDAVLEERASRLTARNADWDWLYGRTPSFDLETSVRFAWGSFEMHLQLQHGRILEAEIYSDAMDPEFIMQIPGILRGVPFHAEAMIKALEALRTEKTDAWITDISRFLEEKAY